ncbi:type II toxin-antitoxin system death-on-curing family toxin [bacterium]|nr:type II toxin-antitoxin system death-on-curing family toxin [bacterium]
MKSKKDNKVTIFKTKDGPAVDVQINNETAWLNQNQMTDLFEKDQSVISRHLNNIFKEKELDKKSNMQKMHIPNSDKPVNFYSLDVIISVGYRVKSKRGTQFRIWANKILKEFLLEGYAINQTKLKGQSQKIKQLETTIKSIVEASHQKELSNTEAKGILNLIQDYTLALDLLDDYDHQRLSVSQTKKSAKKVITYEQALNAINTLREKFRKDGESVDLFGKEKDQSFESSLSTIYQTFEKKELYPSIEEKAAHLLYFVIKNHSFVDGNKRIAAFVFVWFLENNDYLYTAEGKKRIDDNGLVALCLLIAHSKPEEKETFVKLIVNLINKRNG